MDFTAAVLILFTGGDHSDDFIRVGRSLYVGQTFGPGCRTHQPHEGKHSGDSQVLKRHKDGVRQGFQRSAGKSGGCTYDQWALVVLLVLFKEEDVNAESRRRVQEGEDADGDKEFGRGGVVASQENPFFILRLTGGGIKILLVESDRGV